VGNRRKLHEKIKKETKITYCEIKQALKRIFFTFSDKNQRKKRREIKFTL